MTSTPDSEGALDDHIETLLLELQRQDDAKIELSRQGRQMLRVLLLGISAVIAAVTAFGSSGSIGANQCAVLLHFGCLRQIHFIIAALGFGFVSSFFYTSMSGIDFIAPYSAVELVDTGEILQYQMTGEQYYSNKVGKLSKRIEHNRQHIRALEKFGATAGSSLVLSILSILFLVSFQFYRPISYQLFLGVLTVLLPLFIVAHRTMPETQRDREPGLLGWRD